MTRNLSESEKQEMLGEFHYSVYQKSLSFNSSLLEVHVISLEILRQIQLETAEKDQAFASLMIIFVWTYVSWTQGSFFLGTVSTIQIGMSLPISLMIFKKIMGINYYCLLHVFVNIIIMGIGVDNVFVFHENWVNAGNIKVLREKLALRLSYVFRKASSALFVTSLTTVVSFLFTCICPVLPLVSFGIFAALVIAVNFGMTMLILPNCYLFYERHVRWIGQKVDASKAKAKKVVEKIQEEFSHCRRAT